MSTIRFDAEPPAAEGRTAEMKIDVVFAALPVSPSGRMVRGSEPHQLGVVVVFCEKHLTDTANFVVGPRLNERGETLDVRVTPFSISGGASSRHRPSPKSLYHPTSQGNRPRGAGILFRVDKPSYPARSKSLLLL